MSAKFDRVQGFKFIFDGNAARDIATLLPREKATMDLGVDLGVESRARDTHSETPDLGQLISMIDDATHTLSKIEDSRRHLSFLLQDLKRIIA